MTETDAIVWKGAEALRQFLVPIGNLEPYPGNPRVSDVQTIRQSLKRWGQTRSILTDAADGTRIIAGHHVRLAAIEEGWTHVAAIPNEFADAEEARGYLVADNRIPELGGFDTAALVEHLKMLDELDALQGTGYTRDDLDEQLAKLRQLTRTEPPAPRDPPEPPANLKEVVLLYSPAQHEQVELWLQIVAKEKGTDGTSETFYAALEVAARTLNG